MIELPKVRNTYHDQTRAVRFDVLAYRPLTAGELIDAVRTYLSHAKAKKLKRGTVIQITSIIGYKD